MPDSEHLTYEALKEHMDKIAAMPPRRPPVYLHHPNCPVITDPDPADADCDCGGWFHPV